MGGCEDRICACEAEESSLLEVVARKRLVNTQKTGKGLACSVVICDLWILSVAL